jgi:hypothetical protein
LGGHWAIAHRACPLCHFLLGRPIGGGLVGFGFLEERGREVLQGIKSSSSFVYTLQGKKKKMHSTVQNNIVLSIFFFLKKKE